MVDQAQGHDGVTGDENADRLAREGTTMDPVLNSEPSSESEEEIPLEQIVVKGQPRLDDSDQEYGDQEDSTNEKDHLIDEIEDSINIFNSTFASRGIDLTNPTNNTLLWDYEGVNCSPQKGHVSDGDDNQENLNCLETLNPSMDIDDELSQRIITFLNNYNQIRSALRSEVEKGSSPQEIQHILNPKTSKETPVTTRSPERRSVVRFRDISEVIELPKNDSVKFQLPTPGLFSIPGAQSTPFTRFRGTQIQKNILDEGRERVMAPRRIQTADNHETLV